MPDDSNGIYNVPSGTLVNTGDTVLPSQHNPWALDSSQAISNRFSKDGRSPATGDWDINNFRLKQVGNPTALGDAVNKSYVDTQFTSVNQKISTQSTNYTALLADKATSFRFTAPATLSLTAAATLGSNWWCEVWATNGNVTIDPNGAETINGAATLIVQTGQSAKVFCTGTQFFSWVLSDSLNGPQLQGYYFGLGLTTNATDPANDVDIAVGSAAADTAPYALMQLNTAITKRIDDNWSVGSNQGGLDTGTVSAGGAYYIWLIQRSDTLVTDVLFSLSSTAPMMPSGYDRKRILGIVGREASSNAPPSYTARPVNFFRNPALTPSGSAFTLTGLPPLVQKFTLKFSGLVMSLDAQLICRLGTSGGIVSSGYLNRSVAFQGSSATTTVPTGFIPVLDGSAGGSGGVPLWGTMEISRSSPGSNKWVIFGSIFRNNTGSCITNAGVELGSELTQIQISTAAGTALLSGSKSFSIEWEL